MIVRAITQNYLDLVKYYEGFYPKAYICPAGYLTIGYGHLVKKGEPLEIDKTQAEEYLSKDSLIAQRSVCRLISVPLTDNQYDALCSWTFNLGGGALQRSTLRMKLNRGEYENAPTEIKKWNRVGVKISKGLVRRREAEAKLFGET